MLNGLKLLVDRIVDVEGHEEYDKGEDGREQDPRNVAARLLADMLSHAPEESTHLSRVSPVTT